ncbi:hypothetical protein KSP39_PZI013181 [Platanthera zijinensis]|uniref:BSD2 cysteine rich domain-containing protein n=1 Tax=Platanthera zijinensis TaxID=2320716 RepID=A0AAP0BBF8_9ASPA
MVGASCLSCANPTVISPSHKSYNVPPKSPVIKSIFNVHKKLSLCSPNSKFQSLRVHAANTDPKKKVSSIVCRDCDGNGAISCTQCKGDGVNSVDHFNGQFKAGGVCWLCRGKRDILCGSCNGAGFLGGFMSTFDE